MTVQILTGDCRKVLTELEERSVHCVVSSPPYYAQRDYGHDDQIGVEETLAEYIAEIVAVFREVRRVLRDDGTLWLVIGDSYSNDSKWGGSSAGNLAGRHAPRRRKFTGLKPKDLIGLPWRIAFALQADGWYLRQEIIWNKPNATPAPIEDRCALSHETIFLLAKSEIYYFDHEAIREPAIYGRLGEKGNRQSKPQASFNGKHGAKAFRAIRDMRNKRTVWTVPTKGFPGKHFAVYPPELIIDCIRAGCPEGGTVLDPFGGAGTTALVANGLKRNAILIEVNPDYAALAKARLANDLFAPNVVNL